MTTKKAEVMVREDNAVAINPTSILMQAIQNNTDLTVIEKLMDLQERFETREAKKAFDQSLARFKAKDLSIDKDSKANFGGKQAYTYSTLANIRSVGDPALAEEGLSVTFRISQENNFIKVKTVMSHEFGHSEETEISASADNSGSKNAIQAIGSTITYLEKYGYMAITGMATKDADDDGNSHRPPQPDQQDSRQQQDDRRGASYWTNQADNNAQSATKLQAWYDKIIPEAKKFLQGGQLSRFESYVSQLVGALEDGQEKGKSSVQKQWEDYIKSFVGKSIDEFTVARENTIEPNILKAPKDVQDALRYLCGQVAQQIIDKMEKGE